MSERFCSECGHPNPRQARFCVNCGQRLVPFTTVAAIAGPVPTALPYNGGTDWPGVVTAVLASLGLWHISRKARQTAIAMLFLILFFGLPMVCGFVTFVLEWLGRLLH